MLTKYKNFMFDNMPVSAGIEGFGVSVNVKLSGQRH